VQYIAIKDLKGTQAYRRLHEAYNKGEPAPDLVARLSKEHDDKCPMLFHDKYPTSIMPLYSAVDIQNAFY
jgi:hypothetical protein